MKNVIFIFLFAISCIAYADLPPNSDPGKVFAVIGGCDYRTESCNVKINGQESDVFYSDLSKVIPMYTGSRKEPVYCDGPICYKEFLNDNAIGLNPDFNWSEIAPSEPACPAANIRTALQD